MFGEVVSKVSCRRSPIDVELALLDAILEPVEAHVDCLGAFLLDGVGEDASACCIVGLKWCCRLWVA